MTMQHNNSYEWVTVKTHWCPAASANVSLLEKRVYPSSDFNATEVFRVEEQRCSHDVTCNLNDHVHCKWAATNPNNDPFADA